MPRTRWNSYDGTCNQLAGGTVPVWSRDPITKATTIDLTPTLIGANYVLQFLVLQTPTAEIAATEGTSAAAALPPAQFPTDFTVGGTGVTTARLNAVFAAIVGPIGRNLKFASGFAFAENNDAADVRFASLSEVASVGGSIFDGSVAAWSHAKSSDNTTTTTINLTPTTTGIGVRAVEHLFALQLASSQRPQQPRQVLVGNLVVGGEGAGVSGSHLSSLLKDVETVTGDLRMSGTISPKMRFAAGNGNVTLPKLASIGGTLTLAGIGSVDGFHAPSLGSVGGFFRVGVNTPFLKASRR